MKKLSKVEEAQYKLEKKEKARRRLKQKLIVGALKISGIAFAAFWVIFLFINKLIIGQETKVIFSLIGSSGLAVIVGTIAYRTIKMKLQAKIIASEVVKELDAVGVNPLPALMFKLLYILSPAIILALFSYGVSSYVGSFATVMLQLLVAGLGIIPYALGEYLGWEMKKLNAYTDRKENNEEIVDSVVEKITGFLSQ